MKYEWIDLPERKNCFTVRNAAMINLNTGKVVQSYLANTKIAVVQKCVTPEKTYYRTQDAVHHYLNYAFEASAFGLPNEKAPSEPSNEKVSPNSNTTKPTTRTHHSRTIKKQTSAQKIVPSNGGERRRFKRILSKIFRRKK